LLHDSGYADVGHAKENTIQNDESFSEAVCKCEERGIHSFSVHLDTGENTYKTSTMGMARKCKIELLEAVEKYLQFLFS
jgi:hypothetical protein